MEKIKDRTAAIQALPAEIQDLAVITDGQMLATILGLRDPEHAREVLKQAGVPFVRVSERRQGPRLGVLREFIKGREVSR